MTKWRYEHEIRWEGIAGTPTNCISKINSWTQRMMGLERASSLQRVLGIFGVQPLVIPGMYKGVLIANGFDTAVEELRSLGGNCCKAYHHIITRSRPSSSIDESGMRIPQPCQENEGDWCISKLEWIFVYCRWWMKHYALKKYVRLPNLQANNNRFSCWSNRSFPSGLFLTWLLSCAESVNITVLPNCTCELPGKQQCAAVKKPTDP